VFSLIPSRDVLEEVKVAYSSSKTLLQTLQKASSNVLKRSISKSSSIL
jgi:hypothetical protein